VITLAPTTRMGLRAAAVAMVAFLVAQLPFLARAYWIIITAVLLVYDTAGESNQRALERLVTTALGCVAGFILYHLARSNVILTWVVFLSGIYLAVYFRSDPSGVVYAPMVFCNTVYVVFLFGILTTWTVDLVLERLLDTALGCIIALSVCAVVLPQQASKQFDQDLLSFREACRDHFEKAYAALLNGAPSPSLADRQELLRQLTQLRVRFRTSAYETFPGPAARRRRDLMDRSEALCRHLLAFVAMIPAVSTGTGVALLKDNLARLANRFRAGFQVSADNNGVSASEPFRDEDHPDRSLNEEALERVRGGQLPRADFLTVSPAIYHLVEACRAVEG
jgi:uncharacterized membrane protein YccC